MRTWLLVVIIAAGVMGQTRMRIWNNTYQFGDSAWTDLTYPASLINPVGSASPPIIEDSTGYLLFANAAVNTVAIVFQLPHDYKAGSEIRFHVHWCKATAGSGEVLWKSKYKWTNIGAVSVDWSTLTAGGVAVDDNDLAFNHAITNWGSWSGAGKTLSGLVTIYLERTGTDDVNDTYAGVAKLMSVDLHYQRDSFGSSQEYIK